MAIWCNTSRAREKWYAHRHPHSSASAVTRISQHCDSSGLFVGCHTNSASE